MIKISWGQNWKCHSPKNKTPNLNYLVQRVHSSHCFFIKKIFIHILRAFIWAKSTIMSSKFTRWAVSYSIDKMGRCSISPDSWLNTDSFWSVSASRNFSHRCRLTQRWSIECAKLWSHWAGIQPDSTWQSTAATPILLQSRRRFPGSLRCSNEDVTSHPKNHWN